MKTEVKRLKGYDIDLKDEVTLITYNSYNHDILYVKNKNTKCRIKLLPNHMY
ncbi:MAG: hypothetical protein HFH31_02555, partial [Bacilli bacterium]|nr:hypothetical protein [Bacilli bacterium]